MPSFFARLQNVADMVLRWGCRPGVPAITSRNGASEETAWLAFSSTRPTSLSNVWASSRSNTSGRRVQRAVNSRVRDWLWPPSSQPSRPMPAGERQGVRPQRTRTVRAAPDW